MLGGSGVIIFGLNLIHKLLLTFMLLGWLILPVKYSWIHGITYPLVYWHWTKNDGNCILTELEYQYLRPRIDARNKGNAENNNPGGLNDFPFIRKTFADISIQLNNYQIKTYMLPYLTGVSIISLGRWMTRK